MHRDAKDTLSQLSLHVSGPYLKVASAAVTKLFLHRLESKHFQVSVSSDLFELRVFNAANDLVSKLLKLKLVRAMQDQNPSPVTPQRVVT